MFESRIAPIYGMPCGYGLPFGGVRERVLTGIGMKGERIGECFGKGP